MPYDSTKDPLTTFRGTQGNFGSLGRAVTPSDSEDLDPYAKAIVVTAGGDLVILPVRNADGDTITFTGVSVGFVPPYRVRRVMATGTSASVATVDS
ncbi:MAG: hypothetical protein QHD01_31840 [Bradyrhizobium sp.]|uniref:spike base protein, RCAP_Rcc01079 family n=1 Tax=Bradyrhizobium sp. TaxID=376 RepID=UPI0029AD52D6|nr:hypothetical protein [Bradyrhizobium sp.]MDX3971162.1 hypothetical protein [Bradyrhizobium sp.]